MLHRNSLFVLGLSMVLAVMILAVGSDAKCPPGGCSSGEDDWQKAALEFINLDEPTIDTSSSANSGSSNTIAGQSASSSAGTAKRGSAQESDTSFVEADSRAGLFLKGAFLKPLSSISRDDLIVDVSNKRSKNDGNIIGAINIPSRSFLNDDGSLKPVAKAARILGDAGVTSRDAIIVYSDSFSSGEAAFVFWLLGYLGHENVRALDGGLEDWKKASLPLETKQNLRSPANYTPQLRPELLADWDYVKSGSAQLVDARGFLEYGKARIPGAFYIGTDSILENGRLKAGAELNGTFAKLSKSRPVVVYSSDFMRASLVWYALQLMGFDARIYSWQDWEQHESSGDSTVR
jgi:3-mercaptopyruvate sulfurtransferase SseA